MPTNPAAEQIKIWVDAYSDSLYSRALYKTSRKEVAEDLVQETFVVAFQAFSKFEGKSNPKTWLMGILNNKINDHFRQHFQASQDLPSTPLEQLLFNNNRHWNKTQQPQEWNAEDSILDDADFTQTLRQCLEKLPSKWASALHLKFWEEKNTQQLCQELGISDTNFWQILHRAKLQLRKCLEVNWFNK